MTKTSRVKQEIKELCEVAYKNGFNPLPSVRERFKGLDVEFFYHTSGLDMRHMSFSEATIVIVLDWCPVYDIDIHVIDHVPEVTVYLKGAEPRKASMYSHNAVQEALHLWRIKPILEEILSEIEEEELYTD